MNVLEKKQILEILAKTQRAIESNDITSLVILSNNKISSNVELVIGETAPLITMIQVASATVVNDLLKVRK